MVVGNELDQTKVLDTKDGEGPVIARFFAKMRFYKPVSRWAKENVWFGQAKNSIDFNEDC